MFRKIDFYGFIIGVVLCTILFVALTLLHKWVLLYLGSLFIFWAIFTVISYLEVFFKFE